MHKTASVRWLVLHLGDKLVYAWPYCCHLRSGFIVSLFFALFFITSNAEKQASHSQVDIKCIRSQMVALATVGYEETMADQ